MEAIQYKCPNCGGELTFKPETQDFGCDYCFSNFTQEQVESSNSRASKVITDTTEFTEHTNYYHCNSCGAEVISEDETTATFCYYCHEPVILAGRMTGDYQPSKIIGFKLTREDAEKKFKDWCWKRWFIPKDFKTSKQLEKMTGLYVPFWLADCDVDADYSGLGKVVTTWSSGDYRYTNTKEYNIQRKADIVLERVPADGSSKIEDAIMEAIEPFDYAEMKDFSMSYLSGFFADKYDVGKADVFPRIRERTVQASKSVVASSISSYTSVSALSENYAITNTDWEYVLLPLWFMTYRFNDKVYSFAINGQTGKIAGTPPFDKKKAMLFSGAIGLAVMIIIMLGGYLL